MCERSFLQIDEINKHIINHREVHHEHIGLYQAQQSNRIALMRLFSSVCESEGFHIIGESVFIGNEIGAEHFLKSFITRIPFVDCIVVPDIRTITSNPRNAFDVVDKLQNEGVDLFTMMDDRFSKATSTISVLRAYRQCNKTCKCE